MVYDAYTEFCDDGNYIGACAFLTKLWLEDCQSNHRSSCKPMAVDIPHMPRRLVDLSDLKIRANSTPPVTGRVKVVIADPEHRPQYVAVSYRWPKNPCRQRQLSPETYTTFANGVEASELPALYNDAFTLTLMLGYQYVWIDALVSLSEYPVRKRD